MAAAAAGRRGGIREHRCVLPPPAVVAARCSRGRHVQEHVPERVPLGALQHRQQAAADLGQEGARRGGAERAEHHREGRESGAVRAAPRVWAAAGRAARRGSERGVAPRGAAAALGDLVGPFRHPPERDAPISDPRALRGSAAVFAVGAGSGGFVWGGPRAAERAPHWRPVTARRASSSAAALTAAGTAPSRGGDVWPGPARGALLFASCTWLL